MTNGILNSLDRFFSSVPARSSPDPCLAQPPLMTPRLPPPMTTHIRMTIVAPDIFTTSQKQILCCQRQIEIFRVVWIRSVMSLTAQVGSLFFNFRNLVKCTFYYFILSIMEVQCFLHRPLYSLSGTFHWCPARSMDQCLFSRQQMSRMVLNSHVVVCLFAEHDSPLIGLRNLIMPLRASNLRLVTATCPASI